LQDHGVTVLFTVPFALIQMHLHGALEHRDLSTLRWAIFGGEPFPPKHLRALMVRLPHTRFDN
ncbi:MAG: D-alanine--poly(phosphoribitol) ligase, partial [Akkermansiaceae bacterium]|nr:D-alanine--poly(phosphoribitol) ligase [Akkermansiaceae bacterium]